MYIKSGFRRVVNLIFVFLFSNSLFSQHIHHWENAVSSLTADEWQYTLPLVEPSVNWNKPDFNITGWNSGRGGLGFGDNDDVTVVWNGQGAVPVSMYMRHKFTVSDASKIAKAILYMDYDDAFVAYLNGVEIARSGLTGTNPPFNQSGVDHEALMYQGKNPERFEISVDISSIIEAGDNVLAIQVHNSYAYSSDMTAYAFLYFGVIDETNLFGERTLDSFFEPEKQLPLLTGSLPFLSIVCDEVIPDEPKVMAKLQIIDKADKPINSTQDEVNAFDGYIGIERRGSSSYGYAQRPYAFETRNEDSTNLNISILGMPEENDWALISNYNDNSFVKNALAYEIFRRMGHYAPRYRHVEMFMNYDYQGVYLLVEKIKQDKNRVAIAKLEQIDTVGNALTGGYVFSIDNSDFLGNPNYQWNSNFKPTNRPDGLVRFNYVYPKPLEITNQQRSHIQNYVDDAEKALFGSGFANANNGFRKYFDEASFIDYMILAEVSRNGDGYKKSRYLYKDRDDRNGKIKSGPVWDYDWAWKNLNDCFLFRNNDGSGWAYKVNECNVWPVPPAWEVRMLEDTTFANALNARYFSLRSNVLSNNSINQIIDSLVSITRPSAERHFRKFFNSDETRFVTEIDRMKSWISTRLAWLDNNMLGRRITSTETILADSHVKIYPNPVRDVVHLSAEADIQSIKVLNSQGLLVLQISDPARTFSIDMSKFNSGFYLVHIVTSGGNKMVKRIIKN